MSVKSFYLFIYLFNLQCYLWFPLLSSDLFFPAGVYPTGFAGRRFGVTDKTKRPPKKEFHPQQRTTLRTRKICFWTPLWSVELQFREHSEVTQLHFTESYSDPACRSRAVRCVCFGWGQVSNTRRYAEDVRHDAGCLNCASRHRPSAPRCCGTPSTPSVVNLWTHPFAVGLPFAF